MTSTLRFLVVDDDSDDRWLVGRMLAKEFPGCSCHEVGGAVALETALIERAFDVVITDYRLRWSDGLRVLEQVRRACPSVAVVMFTDTGGEEIAVAAMRAGLDDYVLKSSQHGTRLATVIRAALERAAARQAALAAARSKSEFLARMSHELRTPLNAILGMVELLRGSELDLEQRQWTQTLQSSGRALLTLIEDVIEFSTLEAGRLRLSNSPFDPRVLLRETMHSLAPLASEKGLVLTEDLDPATPAEIVGDPVRLRQILVNLIANAIKFTPSGEVSVRLEVLQRTNSSPSLRITVRDSGIGIARADQARIFQPFEQADGSATRRYGGTGLGLAIVAQLVDLMHGCLGLQSEPGVGSTFTVELPCTILQATAVRSAPEFAPVTRPLRILLAEDDASNRLFFVKLIERAGHAVHAVQDGIEAVSALESQRFDAVLMDLSMPALDGFGATQAIRGREEITGEHVAIVALTAHALPGIRERCLRAGMDGCVTKPLQSNELFGVLGELCSFQAAL